MYKIVYTILNSQYSELKLYILSVNSKANNNNISSDLLYIYIYVLHNNIVTDVHSIRGGTVLPKYSKRELYIYIYIIYRPSLQQLDNIIIINIRFTNVCETDGREVSYTIITVTTISRCFCSKYIILTAQFQCISVYSAY